MNDKLKALRESMASIEENLKKIQADMKPGDMEPYNNMMNMMNQQMANMRQYMYAMEDDMYARHQSHLQGHLPPIKTPSQMEACLKALGMDKDYEVPKHQVTVAKSPGKGWNFEVQLPPLKLS